ncbi:MAG: type II toxin-antitoxin system VapC family toxin [Pseudomonadota bacterium]|nr:type II toxin-antitoxin system VapC family toxin [Pseudomonadota bacterium]
MARESVYWDSAAFLGLLNPNEEPHRAQKCEDVWVAAEKGHLLIVTSTFTVAEVIYIKGVPKIDPAKRPKLDRLFQAPHLAQRPLTRIIAQLARDIVWDSNVKPKDAVHVATSGYYSIKTFHTFDSQLLGMGVINVAGFSVQVKEPYAPRQLNGLDETL